MFEKYLFTIFFTITSLCIFEAHASQSDSLVTCKLSGQLGNQLFEIATTLAYAWDYNAQPLFPDLNNEEDRLSYNRDRIFFRLNSSPLPRKMRKVFRESKWYSGMRIPYQKDLKLVGFFQSWKHFDHQREKLLEVFAPAQADLDYLNKKYGDLLANSNTVAVHVRTFNKGWHQTKAFPFLGLKYYRDAIKLFPKNSIFVVFSDRINWCKKHFAEFGGNFIFIEGNDGIQDLFLMSMMKHHIIANSSFSWWGAYLNRNPEKIVVAPQNWKNPSFQVFPPPQPNDFYLDDWIVVTNQFDEPYPSDMTLYDTSQSLDGN